MRDVHVIAEYADRNQSASQVVEPLGNLGQREHVEHRDHVEVHLTTRAGKISRLPYPPAITPRSGYARGPGYRGREIGSHDGATTSHDAFDPVLPSRARCKAWSHLPRVFDCNTGAAVVIGRLTKSFASKV